MCNSYCFSTAKMVAQTRLNVTLICTMVVLFAYCLCTELSILIFGTSRWAISAALLLQVLAGSPSELLETVWTLWLRERVFHLSAIETRSSLPLSHWIYRSFTVHRNTCGWYCSLAIIYVVTEMAERDIQVSVINTHTYNFLFSKFFIQIVWAFLATGCATTKGRHCCYVMSVCQICASHFKIN